MKRARALCARGAFFLFPCDSTDTEALDRRN